LWDEAGFEPAKGLSTIIHLTQPVLAHHR